MYFFRYNIDVNLFIVRINFELDLVIFKFNLFFVFELGLLFLIFNKIKVILLGIFICRLGFFFKLVNVIFDSEKYMFNMDFLFLFNVILNDGIII